MSTFELSQYNLWPSGATCSRGSSNGLSCRNAFVTGLNYICLANNVWAAMDPCVPDFSYIPRTVTSLTLEPTAGGSSSVTASTVSGCEVLIVVSCGHAVFLG